MENHYEVPRHRQGDGRCSCGLLLTDDQRTEATNERNRESRRLSTPRKAIGGKVRFTQAFARAMEHDLTFTYKGDVFPILPASEQVLHKLAQDAMTMVLRGVFA